MSLVPDAPSVAVAAVLAEVVAAGRSREFGAWDLGVGSRFDASVPVGADVGIGVAALRVWGLGGFCTWALGVDPGVDDDGKGAASGVWVFWTSVFVHSCFISFFSSPIWVETESADFFACAATSSNSLSLFLMVSSNWPIFEFCLWTSSFSS